MEDQNKTDESERKPTRKTTDVVAHPNRPLDIISFLGNEVWIIDDTNQKETNNKTSKYNHDKDELNMLMNIDDEMDNKDDTDDDFEDLMVASKDEIEMQPIDTSEETNTDQQDHEMEINEKAIIKSLENVEDERQTNLIVAEKILTDIDDNKNKSATNKEMNLLTAILSSNQDTQDLTQDNIDDIAQILKKENQVNDL